MPISKYMGANDAIADVFTNSIESVASPGDVVVFIDGTGLYESDSNWKLACG